MYQWPDFTLPPINLWNAPKQAIAGRAQALLARSREKPAVLVNKAELLQQLLRAR